MLKLPGRSRFLLLGILHRSCRGRCSPDRLQADCRLWWRSAAPLQNAETHSLHLDTTNNALHYGSDSLLLLYYIIAGAEKLDSTAHFSIVQINLTRICWLKRQSEEEAIYVKLEKTIPENRRSSMTRRSTLRH